MFFVCVLCSKTSEPSVGVTKIDSPFIRCANTPPNTPEDVAASTQRNFSAVSSIKLQYNGSLVSNSFKSLITFCSFAKAGKKLVMLKRHKQQHCQLSAI